MFYDSNREVTRTDQGALFFFSLLSLSFSFYIPTSVLPPSSTTKPLSSPFHTHPLLKGAQASLRDINKGCHTKLRQDQAPTLCIQVDQDSPPLLMSSRKPIIAHGRNPGPTVKALTNRLSHTAVTHIQKAYFVPFKLHNCQSRVIELPRISKFILGLCPLNLSSPAKIRYNKQKSDSYDLRVNKFTPRPYIYMFLG